MQQISEYDISCPITQQIFTYPVIVENGNTYEHSAILEWFKISDKDPLTNLKIEKTIVPNLEMKKLIEFYLNKDPEKMLIFGIMNILNIVRLKCKKNIWIN